MFSLPLLIELHHQASETMTAMYKRIYASEPAVVERVKAVMAEPAAR